MLSELVGEPELLLGHFRIGWDVVVYEVQDESNDTSSILQPLLVVATKTDLPEVSPVRSSLEEVNPAAANAEQVWLMCIFVVGNILLLTLRDSFRLQCHHVQRFKGYTTVLCTEQEV